MNGLFIDKLNVFAKVNPTSKAPIRPGLFVAAIPSISCNETSASFKAFLTTGRINSICFLLAISGTTPLYT